MSTEVRYATIEDIEKIHEIDCECFADPWPAEVLARENDRGYAHLLVAVENGETAGFADMHTVCEDAHINNIAVSEKYRRKGIASAIMDRLAEICRQRECTLLSLEVRESNTAARALYEKYGFSVAGLRKNFYDKPRENGLTMIKNIEEK